VQQLSAVPFAKATASTAMARKKVKAVPILMAFMAMVCSNNCEVSNSWLKIGQNRPKTGLKLAKYQPNGQSQEKGESRSNPHGLHGYGM
jgi:hypothetical protein